MNTITVICIGFGYSGEIVVPNAYNGAYIPVGFSSSGAANDICDDVDDEPPPLVPPEPNLNEYSDDQELLTVPSLALTLQ